MRAGALWSDAGRRGDGQGRQVVAHGDGGAEGADREDREDEGEDEQGQAKSLAGS